jgi:hypothetical protein
MLVQCDRHRGHKGRKPNKRFCLQPSTYICLFILAVPMDTMHPDKYKSWLDAVTDECSCCLGNTAYITDCYFQYRECPMIRHGEVLSKLCNECPGASSLKQQCPVSEVLPPAMWQQVPFGTDMHGVESETPPGWL